MKLIRFMSANEAIQLLQGKTLKNSTNHRMTGQNSDSVGFCFWPCGDKPDDLKQIHGASMYLSGITTMDVCLIGEVDDAFLKRSMMSWARYTLGDNSEVAIGKYGLKDFTDWVMYTPELPPPGTLLRLIASPHWVRPVRTIDRESWKHGRR